MIGYSTATYTRKCPVRIPKKCQSFQLSNYCLANRGQRTAHGPRTLTTTGTLRGNPILAVSSPTDIARTRHSSVTITTLPNLGSRMGSFFFLVHLPPPLFLLFFVAVFFFTVANEGRCEKAMLELDGRKFSAMCHSYWCKYYVHFLTSFSD